MTDLPDIGNPRFLALLDEMRDTHIRKAAGYSGSDNPDTFANFREAEKWGVEDWRGCLVRMGDKYRRLQNLTRDPANDLVGENVRDTAMDLANYALIYVCLAEQAMSNAPELPLDVLTGGTPDERYGPITRGFPGHLIERPDWRS